MAKVSVIIPVYNGQKYIMAAIKSALDQTFKDIEVIVVDDGSTDRTAEMVLSFRDHVKYVYQEPAGAAKARNQGVAASSGEYLAFLDSDDIWLPHKLEKQVEILDERSEVGVVTADMQVIREDGTPQPEWVRGYCPQDPFCKVFLSGFWLQPSIICLRRSSFNQSGGFADGFVAAGAEDLDFYVRLVAVTKAFYLGEVLALYRNHPSYTNRVALDKNNEYMISLLMSRFKMNPMKRRFLIAWRVSFLSDRGKRKIQEGHFREGRRDLLWALYLMVRHRIVGKKTVRTILRLTRSYMPHGVLPSM